MGQHCGRRHVLCVQHHWPGTVNRQGHWYAHVPPQPLTQCVYEADSGQSPQSPSQESARTAMAPWAASPFMEQMA